MKQGELPDLIQEAFRVVDKAFPLGATMSGVHAYDENSDSYRNSHVIKLLTMLNATRKKLTSLPFKSLNSHERVDLLLALREILKKMVFLVLKRPWEYDPHLFMVPFLSALFYMASQNYAPPEERAFMMARRLEKFPSLLQEGAELLKPLSRIHLERAIPLTWAAHMFFQDLFEQLCHALPRHKEDLQALHAEILRSLGAFRTTLQDKVKHTVKGEHTPSPLLLDSAFLCDTMEKPCIEELMEAARESLACETGLLRSPGRRKGAPWVNLREEAGKRHPSSGSCLRKAYREQMKKGLALSTAWLGPSGGGELPSVIDTPAFMRLHYPTVSYAASGEMEPRQRTFLCLTPLYLSCSEAELISQLSEHNNGRIEHAAFHEGFPGHQLHLLHSARSSSLAIKRTRVKSSLEGWALFCEDVFEEREHYTCDGLVALQEARLWRAARFLVESGLGSGMMSDEEAYRVLTALPGCTPAMAGHEMAGLLLNPGEASLYEIGRAYLKRLRSRFEKLHPQSVPGDFGCLFLKSGAVPPVLAGVLCGLEAEDTLERIYDTLCLELAKITEIWHRETHEFL